MRYLAWALIVSGLAAILFGFEFCRHESAAYQTSNPSSPPEADLNGYTAREIFYCTTGGGIIAFCIELYLRNPGK